MPRWHRGRGPHCFRASSATRAGPRRSLVRAGGTGAAPERDPCPCPAVVLAEKRVCHGPGPCRGLQPTFVPLSDGRVAGMVCRASAQQPQLGAVCGTGDPRTALAEPVAHPLWALVEYRARGWWTLTPVPPRRRTRRWRRRRVPHCFRASSATRAGPRRSRVPRRKAPRPLHRHGVGRKTCVPRVRPVPRVAAHAKGLSAANATRRWARHRQSSNRTGRASGTPALSLGRVSCKGLADADARLARATPPLIDRFA